MKNNDCVPHILLYSISVIDAGVVIQLVDSVIHCCVEYNVSESDSVVRSMFTGLNILLFEET